MKSLSATEPRPASGSTVVVIGTERHFAERLAGVLEHHEFEVAHESPAHLNRLVNSSAGFRAFVRGWVHVGGAITRASRQAVLYVLDVHMPVAGPQEGRQRTEGAFDKWLKAVRVLREHEPKTPIILAVDENLGDFISSAMRAGATDVLSPPASNIEELVLARIHSAIAGAADRETKSLESHPALPSRYEEASSALENPEGVETLTQPVSAGEQEAALERVQAAIRRLPTPEERNVPMSSVLSIAVPELRASSGRLDAKKVAHRLGVSLAKLAEAMPVSRQALSETPDSPRVQLALDPMARVLAVLDDVLPGELVLKWLNTKHSRLGGATPLEALLDGRAERVAHMLEIAREGGVP